MITVSSAHSCSEPNNLDSLIEEMRSFIDHIKYPRLSEQAWLEHIRHRGEDLANKLSEYAAAASKKQAATYHYLKHLASEMQSYASELAGQPCSNSLKEKHIKLEHSYELLLLHLKKLRVAGASALNQSRQLKPVNYARNIFHVSTGLTGVILYSLVLTREQALIILGTIFAVFGTLEITRRLSVRWNNFLVDKLFGAISRPSERFRVTSATIYLMSLTLIVLLFPKTPVLLAVTVLSLADPAASLVGKRWGKRKLFRDKSMVGTTAFFIVGTAAAAVLLMMIEPGLGALSIAVTSVAVAAAGAVTELLSSRIDDNFSIPVVCALIATLLL